MFSAVQHNKISQVGDEKRDAKPCESEI